MQISAGSAFHQSAVPTQQPSTEPRTESPSPAKSTLDPNPNISLARLTPVASEVSSKASNIDYLTNKFGVAIRDNIQLLEKDPSILMILESEDASDIMSEALVQVFIKHSTGFEAQEGQELLGWIGKKSKEYPNVKLSKFLRKEVDNNSPNLHLLQQLKTQLRNVLIRLLIEANSDLVMITDQYQNLKDDYKIIKQKFMFDVLNHEDPFFLQWRQLELECHVMRLEHLIKHVENNPVEIFCDNNETFKAELHINMINHINNLLDQFNTALDLAECIYEDFKAEVAEKTAAKNTADLLKKEHEELKNAAEKKIEAFKKPLSLIMNFYNNQIKHSTEEDKSAAKNLKTLKALVDSITQGIKQIQTQIAIDTPAPTDNDFKAIQAKIQQAQLMKKSLIDSRQLSKSSSVHSEPQPSPTALEIELNSARMRLKSWVNCLWQYANEASNSAEKRQEEVRVIFALSFCEATPIYQEALDKLYDSAIKKIDGIASSSYVYLYEGLLQPFIQEHLSQHFNFIDNDKKLKSRSKDYKTQNTASARDPKPYIMSEEKEMVGFMTRINHLSPIHETTQLLQDLEGFQKKLTTRHHHQMQHHNKWEQKYVELKAQQCSEEKTLDQLKNAVTDKNKIIDKTNQEILNIRVGNTIEENELNTLQHYNQLQAYLLTLDQELSTLQKQRTSTIEALTVLGEQISNARRKADGARKSAVTLVKLLNNEVPICWQQLLQIGRSP